MRAADSGFPGTNSIHFHVKGDPNACHAMVFAKFAGTWKCAKIHPQACSLLRVCFVEAPQRLGTLW